MSIKNYISENKLLIVVVLLAAVLRFWNFFEIPLTHDEVSALNRTHYDNFDDLIEYGVKADTHPPGVQAFTYLWVKAFGYEQWVVKLPFILMGLGSLLITYSIFKKWSNKTVALLIIAFMSTLQFTVMYGQIARPYISGMFLVLCMTYFWDGLVNRPEKHFWRNLVLTAVFGAACGYNHHFSLLAAFIIGITGVFLIEKKYLLKYMLLGFLIIILYLPNIPIFLHQLDRGGVGEWLGAPTPRFILDFFSYIFNHSLSLMFVFILVIAVGIYNYQSRTNMKWVYISAIWFFGVWIIGYYYSVYRNPVLQFSMLLFFFPFLLYSLLGWIPQLSKRTQLTLVTLILLVGTTSLTFHRKYFEIFYSNRYYQMKVDAAKCDQDNTCFVFVTHPHFLKIDFPRNVDLPQKYLTWESNINTIKEFEQYISECNKEQFFLGHMEQFPKELIAIAQNHYPFLIESNEVSGATSYLFSKVSSKTPSNILYSYDIIKHPTINYHPELQMSKNYYTDTNEWSLGAEINIADQLEHIYDIMVVNAKIKVSSPDRNILLVTEFPNKNGGEPFFYKTKSISEFTYNINDSTVNLISAFSMDNLQIEKSDVPEFKTYIWNIDKTSFTILRYDCQIIKGNRMKYSLWENF